MNPATNDATSYVFAPSHGQNNTHKHTLEIGGSPHLGPQQPAFAVSHSAPLSAVKPKRHSANKKLMPKRPLPSQPPKAGKSKSFQLQGGNQLQHHRHNPSAASASSHSSSKYDNLPTYEIMSTHSSKNDACTRTRRCARRSQSPKNGAPKIERYELTECEGRGEEARVDSDDVLGEAKVTYHEHDEGQDHIELVAFVALDWSLGVWVVG